ncbi:MAG: hypothetical protein ACLFR7_02570 [Opitutales bacterium]
MPSTLSELCRAIVACLAAVSPLPAQTIIGSSAAEAPTVYHFKSNLTLEDDLVVAGPVVMKVDGDLNLNNHTITINADASIHVYAGANVNVSSDSRFINRGRPTQLRLYGMARQGQQDFVVTGDGGFEGVIYAPNAHVMLNGDSANAGYFGAFVAKRITFNGSTTRVHFDESLKDVGVDLISDTQTRGVELSGFGMVNDGTTIELSGSNISIAEHIDNQF